jgi:hypothetical protein
MLSLLPEFRHRIYVVKTLQMLRHYIKRSGLLVTVRVGRMSVRKQGTPLTPLIGCFAGNCVRDERLGFQAIARSRDGWFVADWSV